MIPPFIRRCPNCGHIGRSRTFSVVTEDGQYLVECPSCSQQFEPIDKPWLQ